jgi:hypothetical protein
MSVVSASFRHFSFCSYAILIKTYNNWAACEVSSVVGNTIILSSQPSTSWAAGTKVYPAFAGLLGQKSLLKSYTDSMSNYEVNAEEVPFHIQAGIRPVEGGPS